MSPERNDSIVTLGDSRGADEDTPSGAALAFFVVALGASAGGVEALLRFFEHVPADSGCAYIAVMHLSPTHESRLAQLIGSKTSMPTVQVDAPSDIETNHVYVGAPGFNLEVRGGRLHAVPALPRPHRPSTVDRLMVTLAADQRERAIGIVLTGADGDGAVGVKAIKSEGGFTLAQTVATAAHSGMPSSAIDTGAVDKQLDVQEMPAAIARYIESSALTTRPDPAQVELQALERMLETLQSRFGLDFREYKKPMLLRRMRRRMGLMQIAQAGDYGARVADDAAEAQALLDDLLINVTEFFREPETWEVLARDVLPPLLARHREEDMVRLWVPACSTGQEAYGLAMLLLEQPLLRERRLKLQVFGTDVDPRALDLARRGRYPSLIEHTVSPLRLQRFFAPQDGGWQVRKELRASVMFAPQNVVSDPPFSRVALASCRNLLIYMSAELQRRVLQTLHFALEPGGVLVLGKSETVGPLEQQFEPISKQARIFRRIGAGRSSGFGWPAAPSWRAAPPSGRSAAAIERSDYGHVMRAAMLEHGISAAVLVRSDGALVYFHGPVQAYLQQPEGLPAQDLLSMLSDDLRPLVRAALHSAAGERRRVETQGLARNASGAGFDAVVTVAPAGESLREDLLLVTFERARATAPREAPLARNSALLTLEDELGSAKRELRSAVQELESTNEELKVANEEAMSTNEELQASNEELATSKEELQSINEELTTVNAQLQEKVHELERLTDDLANLLSSSHIATLFLDRELRIKRFTPAATRLFRLLPGDVDRPLSDLASVSDLAALIEDARRVLADLTPVERETGNGRDEFFLRRTLPYRTRGDRIEGVVVTFVDITSLKRAASAKSRLAAVMEGSDDAIVVHARDGRILAWNRGARLLYGHTEDEALGHDVSMLLPAAQRTAYAAQIEQLLQGGRARGVEAQRVGKDERLLDVSTTVSVIDGEDGEPAFALIERDIGPAKQAERELRESEQRFRSVADSAPVMMWMSDAHGVLEFANAEMVRGCGLDAAHTAGRVRWTDLVQHEDQPAARAALAQHAGTLARRFDLTLRLQQQGGTARWVKVSAIGRGDGWIGSMLDVDEQVRAEQALRSSDRRKDEFLAMLGHELRNPLAPIRNAAEVLHRVGGDDARIAWVREVVVRQVAHITRLVDDLLDISHFTRGTLQLHRGPVELRHLVRASVDGVRPLLERRRHRFESRAPDGALWVEGDAVRLAQVVDNLLTNAAKYTDEGGEILLTLSADGDSALLRVQDNGIGIAPEMQPRIFDLFVQDPRSLDRSEGGLGVGLALAAHIVELHGGSIQARSDGIGHGSTLSVRLPRLTTAAPTSAPDAPAAQATQGTRVLLVEDDADAGATLLMLLQLCGHEVALAHDLASALETARRLQPQAVVMDLGLPGASGYEVAAQLRMLSEVAAGTPFIALTGFGQEEDVRRSATAGFARHLVKPADPALLDRLLRELLRPEDAPVT